MTDRGQRWVARKFPRATRIYLWIWFALITIAAIAYLPYAIGDLATASTAGARGTVVIRECDNNHGVYQQCFGDFTSGNGQVTLHNVQVNGGNYATVGARYPAYGDAATGTVSKVRSGGQIAGDVAVSLVLLAMWVPLFGYCVYRPIVRRRRRPAASSG